MALSNVIESVFTAKDAFTSVLKKMTAANKAFGDSGVAAVTQTQRRIDKLTPSLGGLQQQMLSFASTASVVALGAFSTGQIVEYEQQIANVQSILGLTGAAFEPFKKQIKSVSLETKSSSVEVAKAFQLVGSANADLLKSPSALAEVTKQAIILSEAGGMSIEMAANSLTQSMNQFGVGADQAKNFIDILATSQQKGTATIDQLSEAMIRVGGTAKAFGLDFAQTNVYLQAFAKGGVVGSEAGTQLAGVLSKLAKSTDKNLNPAVVGGQKAIENLMNSNLTYSELLKITDAEGAKWITTLVNQKNVVAELTGNLLEQNNALKQSDNNMNTVQGRLSQLKGLFVTYITTTDTASTSTNILKDTLKFIGDNLSIIIPLAFFLLTAFVAYVFVMKAASVALATYEAIIIAASFVQGAYTAIMGASAIALRANSAAMLGYSVVTKTAAAVQWVMAAAMNGTFLPILLIIGAIAAVIAIIYLAVKYWDQFKEAINLDGIIKTFRNFAAHAVEFLLAPLQTFLALIDAVAGTELSAKIDSFVATIRGPQDGTDSEKEKPAINTKADQMNEQVIREESVSNKSLDLNIIDKTGSKFGVQTSDSTMPGLNLSSTKPAYE